MLRRWLRSGPPGVSRREAERLLDGGPVHAAGPHRDLAHLLAAAAGPARPDELDGERAAVAAFRREFRPNPAPAQARRPRRRAGIVAALTAAVLAVGGTAYAATTGHLPDAVQRAVDGMFSGGDPSGSPGASPDGSTGTSPAPTGPTTGPTGTEPGVAPGAPGVDEARLKGLCRSWEATRANPHANAISADDLRVLTAAAGGEDRIEAYCAALANKAVTPSASDKPGNPDPGGGRPSAPPGGGHTKGGSK